MHSWHGGDASAEYQHKLTGEHKYGDAGQGIISFIFILVWMTDGFFGYSTVLNQCVPSIVRTPLGIILFVLAGYFASNGLYAVFVKKRKERGVIREGVYSIVRHPVYLGEILLYLGFIMFNMSLAAIAIWVIAIVFTSPAMKKNC